MYNTTCVQSISEEDKAPDLISIKSTLQVFQLRLKFTTGKKRMTIQASFKKLPILALVSRPVNIKKTFSNSTLTQ